MRLSFNADLGIGARGSGSRLETADSPVVFQHDWWHRSSDLLPINMSDEVPYGTLDLMVLKTLAAMGPLHGYGVARRLEQTSGDELAMNEGTIYASLVRLEQRRLIKTSWGTSENSRRAKYYSLTRAGEKALTAETTNWTRLATVIGRVLATGAGGDNR